MKSVLKDSQIPGLPFLLLAIFLYLSIFGLRIYSNYQNRPETITRIFQKEIFNAEEKANRSLKILFTHFDTGSCRYPAIKNGLEAPVFDKGIYLFVFKNDSLCYWSNNKMVLPENVSGHFGENNGAVKLKNGWYGFHVRKSGHFVFLGFYLIKSQFPFQNNFIKNKFSALFSCPESVNLESKKGEFPITSGDQRILFSLNFSKYTPQQVFPVALFFMILLVGALCLFYFIYRIFNRLPRFKTKKNLMVLFFCADIVLLRGLQYWLRFPEELAQSELFSPALYSSTSLLPSLGDFTLNVILLFVICLAIYNDAAINPSRSSHGRGKKLFINSLLLFLLLCFFRIAGDVISDLIINSSLSLNLQDISSLAYDSIYGLFIISMMLFSFWLISTRVFNDIIKSAGEKKHLSLSAIISGVFYCFVFLSVYGKIDIIYLLFFYFYFGFYWYLKLNARSLSVHNLLFILCFYAVFATVILNRANARKEQEKINLLALKLATRRNPVTEVLFEQVERKLLQDSIVKAFLQPKPTGNTMNQENFLDYLKNIYFNDYWKKYDLQITICDSLKELRIQPQGYLINCGLYFRGIIRDYGEPTSLPNLFFLDYGLGKEYYLAILSENREGNPLKDHQSLILEFNLLNTYPDPGYPGLLMDNTRIDLPNLSDYSYGLYQNGRLVHSVGSYNYRIELNCYKGFSQKNLFFKEDQMIHYHYFINESDSLLISKNDEFFLTRISPFSYLLILFTIISFFIFIIIYYPRNPQIISANLRNRLHASLIGILVVTLAVIGIVQIINIININSKKNLANLKEKAYSVQVEIQHRYSNLPEAQSISKSELEDFLIKLSNVFFSDINFYDKKGILVASSRGQIFEEGLVSKRMNPEAFEQLIIEKGSAYIHNESIGNMRFSSAYLPLYNNQNHLLGYINLPYFSRQDELKKEISTFLVTFLNIYILLLLFGVFITILISNYITAPLSMLSDKMSRLRLGLVNDKIEWKHGDEIGQLVQEYNRMIDELGRSAEVLARSERESAWREMARQVAHEIKNPLTPMKLSAQYLQKAWNDKAPDMDERMARFTRTLIEQIETLSAIASDFSSFAKMPAAINEWINLKELIQFVLSMYKDSSEIQYEFKFTTDDPIIFADRALLIRIFTNLLNNAVQAIGDDSMGKISIVLSKEGQKWVIAISDNGSGISADRAGKIFQPDFTTKSGGMGLGLAIVKSIVTGMQGEITFSSTEQHGTTFIIKIPINEMH